MSKALAVRKTALQKRKTKPVILQAHIIKKRSKKSTDLDLRTRSGYRVQRLHDTFIELMEGVFTEIIKGMKA